MSWIRLRPLELVERSLVPVLDVEPWVAALRQKLAADTCPVALFGENEGEAAFASGACLETPASMCCG